MYDRACGVNNFNQRLQQRLTDSDDETPTDFRIGDKVMQTENNYEKNVFNGNTGLVVNYDDQDGELVVEFPETEITATYNNRERKHELTLAYAITVHKSQGSEYPAVLIPVAKAHTYMLKRPLLYTAVTRAEEYVLIAGPKRTLNIAVSKEEKERRYTRLEKSLKE
jgi:exodeoxyribonuclease V alpha subunit